MEFCGPVSHLREVQFRIWNPHRISKWKKKKKFQIGPLIMKLDICGQRVIWGKVQYRIWNPNQISKSKKKNLFKSVQKQSWQSFRESTLSDLESQSNFQVEEKKLLNSVKKQWNYALIKNAKIVMFKMDVRTSRYWL